MSASITRFAANSDPDDVFAAIDRDGVVIIEELLTDDIVQRVNEEVEAAVDAADPNEAFFNPIMQRVPRRRTRSRSRACRASRRTFAIDVMCHPLLLALCDRVLLPSCARYQLNLGHLLQRGPGSEEQWLHRDELVWSDVPWPHPELQLASVIAFVDFTRDNGATRVVPGSHRWPDRGCPPVEQMQDDRPTPEQIAYAEMPAGSAVVYTGGTIHAGGANTTDVPRRGAHLSYCLGWLRTEENNYLSIAAGVSPRRCPRLAQELLGYAVHDSIPRAAATSAWCACRTRSSCSRAASSAEPDDRGSAVRRADRRAPPCPRPRRFELGREAEQRRLVAVPTQEVHADRQPVTAPGQRHRHRRVAGEVRDDAGVHDRRTAALQSAQRFFRRRHDLADGERRRRERRRQPHVEIGEEAGDHPREALAFL